MTFQQSFGVAVLGATGYIAAPYRREIREAKSEAKIVALSARRAHLLAAAGIEDDATVVSDDWRSLIRRPDVDLVLVCTPDALHYEAVMECAAAGKHVVCEKPIGMNAGEAWRMSQAVRQQGLGHFVPFWTRYVPVCVRAREIVVRGELGKIRAVVYRWHNPRPLGTPLTWRDDARLSSAGTLADVGSHAYDTIRWIIGCDATRVLAHTAILGGPKPDVGQPNLTEALAWNSSNEPRPLANGTVCDFAAVSFELENGAVGNMVLSHAPFFRKGLAPELELHGSHGSLAVYRMRSAIRRIQCGEEQATKELVPDPGPGNRFVSFVFPALRAQLTEGQFDHPNLHDGYRVQLFTDAAAESARRRTWVDVSEIDQTAQHG